MSVNVNWGISDDMQARVRFEPNSCNLYVMDISLGCPHHCVYCIFSQLEQRIYKFKNPTYSGKTIPLKLDEIMKQEDFPPVVYMCYSSDPLGNEELATSSAKVLKRLIEHDVHVSFITKGLLTQEVLEVMALKPELVQLQIGITSADDYRNSIVEPGAPNYADRLKNLDLLKDFKGLGYKQIRIDPMLPGIDDTEENICRLLDDFAARGVERVVISYLILTKNMKDLWKKDDFLTKSVELMTEKTPTVSGQEVYSVPYEYKIEKLKRFNELCEQRGIKMSTCACKDERLMDNDFNWICHPFTKEKREELLKCADSKYFNIRKSFNKR